MPMHTEVKIGQPGWIGQLTERFVFDWLEDYYVRAPEQPALAQQMYEHAMAEWGVDADAFTAALVQDLERGDASD